MAATNAIAIARPAAPRALDPARAVDHIDTLYRVAMAATGNVADAEDLVQETYAKVLSRPRFLRNDDDVGYLIRSLRNVHRSMLRRANSRPRTSHLEDHEPHLADARTPDRAAEAADVLAIVSRLPPDQRDAVIAVDVAGLSYAEAGRLLGAKEATITSRLHRGRAKVAAEFG